MGNALIYISYFSVLVPLFFYYKHWKRNAKHLYLEILAVLLATSALSDLASFVLIKTGNPSLLAGNIYITLQFFILVYMYHSLLEYKPVIYAGIAMFIITKVFSHLFFQSFTDFDSWNRVSSALIMIVLSVTYYMEVYVNQPTKNITTYPPIWINTAVFFYFTFNVFLFLFSNYVFTNLSEELSMTFWAFHNVNNIIKNVLFAVGIYWAGDRVK